MSPWVYRPPITSDIVELATVAGSAVALPPHLHEEDQVTFVLEGRRRFQLGDETVELRPGDGIIIGAGRPHSSLSEAAGVVCFNAYVKADTIDRDRLTDAMTRLWTSNRRFSVTAFADCCCASPSPGR